MQLPFFNFRGVLPSCTVLSFGCCPELLPTRSVALTRSCFSIVRSFFSSTRVAGLLTTSDLKLLPYNPASRLQKPSSGASKDLLKLRKLQRLPNLLEYKMAVVRDPQFWRRFSMAVHLDEEKGAIADHISTSTSSSKSQLKHT